MNKLELIGNRIKNLIMYKNISQAKFAKMMNVDQAQLSRWVNGRQNMTIHTIERMEEILQEQIIHIA